MVEKILAPHEHLRADWPVQGTSGYDYLNLSLGVLVDPSGEAAFTETYGAFAGASDKFEEIARLCKLRIMDNEMSSELNALAGQRIQVNKSAALGVECVFAVEARVQETRGACNSAVFPERTSASYETSRRRRKRQRRISYASLT